MKAIQRLPIREQIYKNVLDSIVTGVLTPGARVKDTDLAEQLEVRRTPVRETLIRLEQDGFLENHVGRGFVVRPLELREIEESYPILWTLEVLALKKAGNRARATTRELVKINDRIRSAVDDPVKLIELDTIWHSRLIENCDNERLVAAICHLKTIVRRYEYAYMQIGNLVDASTEDHARITQLLENEDLQNAGALLEKHWQRSLNEMAKLLGG